MGYAMVIGQCFACSKVFSFNPHKVPSYQGKPICRSCIKTANVKRKELGNPQWPVPENAYEPIDEYEL